MIIRFKMRAVVNTQVTKLILYKNSITDVSIPTICECLAVTKLRKLSLSWNLITESGSVLLCQGLQKAPYLNEFNLESFKPMILQLIVNSDCL